MSWSGPEDGCPYHGSAMDPSRGREMKIDCICGVLKQAVRSVIFGNTNQKIPIKDDFKEARKRRAESFTNTR